MRITTLVAVCGSSLFVLLVTPSFAQGSREDFVRAAKYDERTRGLVYRDEVKPRFLGGGSRFWYRVRTGKAAQEYVLIDPEAGTKAPLFDHAALARSLSEAESIVPELAPGALDLERLEVDDSLEWVRFRAFSKFWAWRRGTNELVRDERATPAIVAVRPGSTNSRSRGGGHEVTISIVNDHPTEVEILWLDFDGGRRSYGKLGHGERLTQHTYARHVFVAVDSSGSDVAAFVIGTDAANGDEARVPIEAVTLPANSPAEIDAATDRRSSEDAARLDSKTSPDPYRVRIDEGALVLTRRSTGSETRFDPAEYDAHAFSGPIRFEPSRRYCALLLHDRGSERRMTIVESSPRDQVQPKTHTYPYDKPGDSLANPRVCILDCEEGTIRRVTPVSIQESAWEISRLSASAAATHSTFESGESEIGQSIDGNPPPYFRFLYNQRGHQVMRYVEVAAATGEARTIIEEVSPTFLDYSNKTYLASIGQNDSDLLWMSERSGWNHLYRIDAATGTVKNAVTTGEYVVRRVVEVDAEQGCVYFIALGVRAGEDPYHEHLCRASLDGSRFERLTEGDGTHRIEFTPDRRYFVDRWSRVDHPRVTELRRVSDGSLVVELERADWDDLRRTGWRPAERFVAKGRDGVTDIHGIIVRPNGYDEQKRYPVVEHIYAGPHDQHVPKEFSPLVYEHQFAELGFIVVRIDGMGTNWRSKAFHDVCWRNLKDAGLPDRIAWIRAAAATDPAFDVTRVGIFGGSAGGQNALAALLHHGDFYKVAVADCGCHDNRMDKVWWNEAWMGWPVGDWYADNSNVHHAGKLSGKLMLIVGELDQNVDPASTMQVADALIRADKDFDLLVLPGVGHGAAESPYGRRRRADFLVRHLLGVEPRSQ